MTAPLRVVMWPAESNRADQPYNWLLTQSLRSTGVVVEEFSRSRVLSRPDVWHLHWPDAVLNDPIRRRAIRNLGGLLALLRLARRRGTAIVWTIHNLQTHDQLYPRLERWFWHTMPGLVDGFICLSESSRAAAQERLPILRDRPGYVIPLGHYRGIYPDTVTTASARKRLGLDVTDRVVTFIGQVRPYKGVPALVDCFRQLDDPKARLVIAGRPNSDLLASAVRAAADDDERVQLHLGFIEDGDLQVFLRASDVVVLPFIEILNSASAMLALTFDRPVLVPARGSMAELRDRIGEDWVRTYTGPLSSDCLAETLTWAARSATGHAPLDAFGWPAVGAATAAAYRGIIASRAAVRS